MTQKKPKQPKRPKKDIVRRLPADERRKAMLDDAAVHFAEHGFGATTRDIADALGVTQALIYKHFKSKEDLIERTLERAFVAEAKNSAWIDPKLDLKVELLRFYIEFVGRSSELRMRLFIRSGLDGRSWPARRGQRLNTGLFSPVIEALRAEVGLPDLNKLAAMRGERELVMALHASMVFLGIRRHIYGTVMPKSLDDVVRLYIDNFLTGAVKTIKELHSGGEESLTIPFATDPKRPRSV